MAPKPCTPAYFGAFLARSWAEGTTKVRQLFADIRHRGFTGSYSHLTRFLAPWRNDGPSQDADNGLSADQEAPAPLSRCCLDGSGSNMVILDLVEGAHSSSEQCDAGSPVHCAFEHF
jgi:hypothetical protein